MLSPRGVFPLGLHPAAVGVCSGVVVLLIMQFLFRKAYRRRWHIDEHEIRVEGLFSSRSISLDEVMFIEQTLHEKSTSVIIRSSGGASEHLQLTAPDAEECAASLRSLCAAATLLHADGTVEPPSDPLAWQTAAMLLRRRCSRLVGWHLAAAAFMGVMSVGFMLFAIARLQRSGSTFGVSIAVGCGAAFVYCITNAARAWRGMKAFGAGAEVFGPAADDENRSSVRP